VPERDSLPHERKVPEIKVGSSLPKKQSGRLIDGADDERKKEQLLLRCHRAIGELAKSKRE
jgi:hypothetical protein